MVTPLPSVRAPPTCFPVLVLLQSEAGGGPDLAYPRTMIARPIAPAGLHAQEISTRPPRTRAQQLNAVLCAPAFLLGCCMVNFFQFMFLLPLCILPFPWARTLYRDGIRYTKGAYGNLLGASNDGLRTERHG